MLKIRNQQMQAFQSVAETAFLRKLVEYLYENHPQIAVQIGENLSVICQIPEKELKILVASAINHARTYGITSESSLAAFVVLMFVIAPNFDEHPLIKRLLEDEKIAPNDRIDSFWQHTTEQNWQMVKQNYDPKVWQNLKKENK